MHPVNLRTAAAEESDERCLTNNEKTWPESDVQQKLDTLSYWREALRLSLDLVIHAQLLSLPV
jgi:hypothetical protein